MHDVYEMRHIFEAMRQRTLSLIFCWGKSIVYYQSHLRKKNTAFYG